jgi:hypothetical protein
LMYRLPWRLCWTCPRDLHVSMMKHNLLFMLKRKFSGLGTAHVLSFQNYNKPD